MPGPRMASGAARCVAHLATARGWRDRGETVETRRNGRAARRGYSLARSVAQSRTPNPEEIHARGEPTGPPPRPHPPASAGGVAALGSAPHMAHVTFRQMM